MSQLPAKPSAGVYLPAPTSFEEAYRIAKVLAASDLVPKDYKDRPENCLVAMQWGADVGLPGLQALQNIAVINGRPSIWGDAALAIVKNHPNFVNIHENIEGTGDQRVAVCIINRKNQSEVRRTFSVENAKKAGLWNKSGPWQAYPERMLQLRARGFALRDAFPDALRGLSIAEESQDIPEKNMGAAEVVETTEIQMPKPKSQQKPEPKQEQAPEPEEKATVIDNETGEILNAEPQQPEPEQEPQQKPEQEPQQKPEQEPQQQTAPGQASPGMLVAIRKRAQAKEIPEEVILAEHDLEKLEGISEAKGNEILNWIRAQ